MKGEKREKLGALLYGLVAGKRERKRAREREEGGEVRREWRERQGRVEGVGYGKVR